MKSERISIFNYEAFYLDHLEGNLGEEDTALLFAFLEGHPDLIEEEEDFVLLDPALDTPVFEDKNSLKVVSDNAGIALSNVEHFLIAESEGQLPAAKQEELNAFVIQHPHLEKERAYLAAMFLKADESIVYAEKSGLKRKGAIIFWPYVALAAASVLIAFFFVMNNGGEDTPQFADETTTKKNEELKQESPIVKPENIQYANDETIPSTSSDADNASGEISVSPNQRVVPQRVNAPNNTQLASVNTMERQQARRVLNSIDNQDLQPVASHIDPPALTFSEETDVAQVSNTEMKNPIRPITSRIGKGLKTKVDFQTGKAANNAGAGFLLKIGKFEISRKNGKKKRQK